MKTNSIYLFILSLSIIFYFIIFALEINIHDLIGDKFTNLLKKLHIETFELKPIKRLENQGVTVQYPPLKPQYIAESNEYTRPELLNMSILYNNKETRLMAANEDVEEENCAVFGNQKTNISEFVKLNENKFFSTVENNRNIKHPDEWELKGTILFNKILNDRDVKVEPFDDQNYKEYN